MPKDFTAQGKPMAKQAFTMFEFAPGALEQIKKSQAQPDPQVSTPQAKTTAQIKFEASKAVAQHIEQGKPIPVPQTKQTVVTGTPYGAKWSPENPVPISQTKQTVVTGTPYGAKWSPENPVPISPSKSDTSKQAALAVAEHLDIAGAHAVAHTDSVMIGGTLVVNPTDDQKKQAAEEARLIELRNAHRYGAGMDTATATAKGVATRTEDTSKQAAQAVADHLQRGGADVMIDDRNYPYPGDVGPATPVAPPTPAAASSNAPLILAGGLLLLPMLLG